MLGHCQLLHRYNLACWGMLSPHFVDDEIRLLQVNHLPNPQDVRPILGGPGSRGKQSRHLMLIALGRLAAKAGITPHLPQFSSQGVIPTGSTQKSSFQEHSRAEGFWEFPGLHWATLAQNTVAPYCPVALRPSGSGLLGGHCGIWRTSEAPAIALQHIRGPEAPLTGWHQAFL